MHLVYACLSVDEDEIFEEEGKGGKNQFHLFCEKSIVSFDYVTAQN